MQQCCVKRTRCGHHFMQWCRYDLPTLPPGGTAPFPSVRGCGGAAQLDSFAKASAPRDQLPYRA